MMLLLLFVSSIRNENAEETRLSRSYLSKNILYATVCKVKRRYPLSEDCTMAETYTD